MSIMGLRLNMHPSLVWPDPSKGLASINVGRLLNKGKLAEFSIFFCVLNHTIFHYRCHRSPTKLFLHLCEAIRLHVGTVFLRSDAAVTIYFAACFVFPLFEGGVQGRREDWGGPQNGLCEGGLGACSQEILRFYML